MLFVAGLTVSGCGGSSGASSAAEAPEPEQTSTPEPAVSEAPVEGVETDVPKESASADVLLLEPAGRADLPQDKAPSLQFSALPPKDSDANSAPGLTFGTSNETLASGNVTVSWDPPVQNADGSDINDLAGYRIYQGNEEQLTIVQEINEPGSGERRLAQVTGVTTANSCFAVTAFDTRRNESALGDIVCKDVIVAEAPTNPQAPTLTSVTQLSTNDGQADIQLAWQQPRTSAASPGSTIRHYNIFHGSQSQLFKIGEAPDDGTGSTGDLTSVVSNIGGEQACFALTADYTDGTESSLGEIVCIALVHTTPPQPGSELRPFNVSVDIVSEGTAIVSWDRPNTVVSSADATSIDRYDLYQGSSNQVFKITEIPENGDAGTRRSTMVENVFEGSNCFALTATDQSFRQSALSTIVCGVLPTAGSITSQPPGSGTIGVSIINAQETSPGSVALAWDAPDLVVAGQPISNLAGYNIYQGSRAQLFKVAEVGHNAEGAAQQFQRNDVNTSNACFAVTAYDVNNFESPLSPVVCAAVSSSASVPEFGIVPPTSLTTSALGGSSTVKITWVNSGVAATGSVDANVDRYNIYQGDHDRLFKVREILQQNNNADVTGTSTFTGVTSTSSCFAITAQYPDLRESRLSEIVCRDD